MKSNLMPNLFSIKKQASISQRNSKCQLEHHLTQTQVTKVPNLKRQVDLLALLLLDEA